MQTPMKKVFCVGANKTATTSLRDVLVRLGYKVPNTQLQERTIGNSLRQGDYSPLKRLVRKYDAFKDIPFSIEQNYAILDALFPNQKFILTVRDPDAWFDSLVAFHKKVFGFDSVSQVDEDFVRNQMHYVEADYMHEHSKRIVTRFNSTDETIRFDWSRLYDKGYRVSQYLKRNEDIIRFFFNRPEQLLVIDLTREKDTSKIIDFLGLPLKFVSPVPHMNAT